MKTDARSQLMASGEVSRVLTRMTIPAVISMVIGAVYNIVDTIFVGRIGTEAIGATIISFPIFMLITTIGLSVGLGAASYISRLLGEQNIEEANRTCTTAGITIIAIALIFTCEGLLFLRPILILFGATETILPYAMDYAQVLVIGSVFRMMNICLNNTLRAEGSYKISMLGISFGAILNIVLDPLFIFTFGMGIRGAAVATVLSQAVVTMLLSGYYVTGKSLVILHFSYFLPSKRIYSEIFKIGASASLRQGLASISFALINTAARTYGDAAIAALGIIVRMIIPGFMIMGGFAQGFRPIAGFSYGAKRYDRLLEAIYINLRRTTVVCAILTIIFMVFTEPIIRLFSRDPEVIALGVKGLRYFSLILPALGFNLTINALFAAIGRAIPAGILSVSRQGIFFIPSLIILPKIFGVEGIFFSQPVADAATTVLAIILGSQCLRQIKRLRDQM